MFVTEAVGQAASFAAVPIPAGREALSLSHSPESYAQALEALGPEPQGDDKYEPRNWPRWFGKKTMLGDEPGEGHAVEQVAADGSSVTVSTEDRYRIIEVPSGRVLTELKLLWETTSEVDTMASGREHDNDPYAIAVSYELISAMSRQSEITWEDISLRPSLVYYKCDYCGSDWTQEKDCCGTSGHKGSDSNPLKRSDLCKAREIERIRRVGHRRINASLSGHQKLPFVGRVSVSGHEANYRPTGLEYLRFSCR
ncbi:hypothetical protein [Lacipirellula parvula]|uniref:Uncharacterized protein n=1 Tax=Lacipirellula parvula TaxID=2650471 RepID=A0A5K7XEW0_9BACT|nr:hypothetical protein [Lacipirellula parvula]BBO34587.1 hypothetical protein PLANPX_4199 [Lacipirellula parvula]